MNKKHFFLTVFCILLLSGCYFDKRGCLVPWDTEGSGFVFEVPVSIHAMKSHLKIGDTLMLIVDMDENISAIMDDGKHKHQLENFPLYIVPQIERLEDNLARAHDFFGYYNIREEMDISTIKGAMKNPPDNNSDGDKRYYFAYNSPRYELRLAIVPKQKGIYVVSFNSIDYPKGSFPWLCTYQNVTARILVNNDKSNYELLQARTAGTPWHVARENRGKGYSTSYTIYHDSLPNYQPPRSLLVDYCFEVN
jgi:hypothetical protein